MSLSRRFLPLFISALVLSAASLSGAGHPVGMLRWDAAGSGVAPDVASNGTTFLSVWIQPLWPVIYATLNDGNGVPIREAIPVATSRSL
ncbi:MAG: hypothetical protein ABIP63_00550, partial [Thermoanaerobaculia bacterium]